MNPKCNTPGCDGPALIMHECNDSRAKPEPERWCIMRDCLNHPMLAPWPITAVQLAIAATGGLPDRNIAESAQIEVFEGEPGRLQAFTIAREMEHPNMRHTVERVESLCFDVWLHNHYDGSTHVQAEALAFDDARLLFLACVGFAASHRRYWQAEMHVPCQGHRHHWRRTDRPVDIRAGRWNYDARAAKVSPSWAELNPDAERRRIHGA